MIIEKFSKLPPWIEYQGINFQLKLINNGRADDNRLMYGIHHVYSDSPHKKNYDEIGGWENPFIPGAYRGFLWLYEGISTDQELVTAIKECREFLLKNGLFT